MKKASTQPEEIDLVQLSKVLGNGLGNIFDSIKKFLGLVLDDFVLVLMFFKKHFKKLIISILLGVTIGAGLDMNKEEMYTASMVVKPNFGSGKQLYNNVAYFNELVAQGDSVLLSEIFQITIEEANSLKLFVVSPVVNEKTLLSNYNEFYTSLDSITAVHFKFDEFSEGFNDYSYQQHEITVTSSKKDVFVKLKKAIVGSVVDNNYLQMQQQVKSENITRNKHQLTVSLKEVDTLRSVYREVLLANANRKKSEGTSINLGTVNESSRELDLFKEEQRINRGLDILAIEDTHSREILSVVSEFHGVGFKQSRYANGSALWLSSIALIIMLLFLLIRDLNRYLISKSST